MTFLFKHIFPPVFGRRVEKQPPFYCYLHRYKAIRPMLAISCGFVGCHWFILSSQEHLKLFYCNYHLTIGFEFCPHAAKFDFSEKIGSVNDDANTC